jgi:hypothetical protein
MYKLNIFFIQWTGGEEPWEGKFKVNLETIVRKEKVNKEIGIGDLTLAGYQTRKEWLKGKRSSFSDPS